MSMNKNNHDEYEGLHTFLKLEDKALYRAYATVGGARLEAVKKEDDDLAKIKIDMQVFRHLCKKKLSGETVRMAAERAIMKM
jgi:hypothetical protein